MPVFGDFSQSVTVGGRPALVHDLAIKESSSERVASIDFVLEPLQVPGQLAALSGAVIGEDVTVTQTVDGASQTWRVLITHVDERRNGAATFKRVQCRSLEHVASHTRFLDVWRHTAASTVVLEAWQRHTQGTPALRDVSLSGVATNNTRIEEYASKYDSLYDLMEEVCLLTGWAWKVRDGVLYYFDPLTNPGPDLTQGSGVTVRDTLQLKQSLEGVYNVYRGQGWSYRTLTIGRQFNEGDCIDGFQFNPAILRGVEVVGEPVIVQQKWRDMGFRVENVDPDGIVGLNQSVTAYGDRVGYFSIQLRVRGLHWVERFDADSIVLYGRRDAPPLSDNGGDNIQAITNKLDELLRYRAYPSYDVTLEVVGVGWEPDQVVQTTLYDPQFSAPLYVTDVQRTTDGTDLNVAVTLTSPSEVVDGNRVPPSQARRSRSNADPAYEIGRRLERLERRNAHPAEPLGQNTAVDGVLGGVYGQRDSLGWVERVIVASVVATGDNYGWAERLVVNASPITVSDAYGWTGTVTAVSNYATGDQQGWTGTTTVDLEPWETVTVADSAAWNQTTSFANIGQSVADQHGWTGAVTTRDPALGITDQHGWTGAVTTRDPALGITDAQGWSTVTTAEVVGDPTWSVDDDAVFAIGEISVDDDVAFES